MTVLQHLEATPGDPHWSAPPDDLPVAAVAAIARRLRAAVAPGAKTALRQPDNFRAALWLAALDGHAECILLLPPSLLETEAASFLAAAGCDVVISSDPLAELADAPAAGAEPCATRWIIPTSGTTGTPKLVSHTLATLTRSAQQDKTRGAAHRWGLLYDLTRFAGLQVFLQAVCGGSGLVFPDAAEELAAQLRFLAAGHCTALSATPTLWRKILMQPEAAALTLRSISMGGEIADRRVLEAVGAAWPEARVRHIYASTEAGVGFSIADGRPGFPAAFLTTPPPGVEVRVDDAGMMWLRPAVRGQNYIREQHGIAAADGWIATGDIVRHEGERFLFCGRENGAINVGGNKVFPQEIEAVILQVPGVHDAVVSGRANPIMGQLVEAQIVAAPEAEQPALRTAILTACRERLPRWQVPAAVKFVTTIVTTAAGKAARI